VRQAYGKCRLSDTSLAGDRHDRQGGTSLFASAAQELDKFGQNFGSSGEVGDVAR
jgi:hypothetical protein